MKLRISTRVSSIDRFQTFETNESLATSKTVKLQYQDISLDRSGHTSIMPGRLSGAYSAVIKKKKKKEVASRE